MILFGCDKKSFARDADAVYLHTSYCVSSKTTLVTGQCRSKLTSVRNSNHFTFITALDPLHRTLFIRFSTGINDDNNLSAKRKLIDLNSL